MSWKYRIIDSVKRQRETWVIDAHAIETSDYLLIDLERELSSFNNNV